MSPRGRGLLWCHLWPCHKAGQLQDSMQVLLHAMPSCGACCHGEGSTQQMGAKAIEKLAGHRRGAPSPPGEVFSVPSLSRSSADLGTAREGLSGCSWVPTGQVPTPGQLPWAPLLAAETTAACGAQGMVHLLPRTAGRIVPCTEFKRGWFFTADSFYLRKVRALYPCLSAFLQYPTASPVSTCPSAITFFTSAAQMYKQRQPVALGPTITPPLTPPQISSANHITGSYIQVHPMPWCLQIIWEGFHRHRPAACGHRAGSEHTAVLAGCRVSRAELLPGRLGTAVGLPHGAGACPANCRHLRPCCCGACLVLRVKGGAWSLVHLSHCSPSGWLLEEAGPDALPFPGCDQQPAVSLKQSIYKATLNSQLSSQLPGTQTTLRSLGTSLL